jgi:hypothetical protein
VANGGIRDAELSIMVPPPKLNGTGPLDMWLNALRDYCIASKPVSTPLIRASETAKGTGLYPQAVGGAAAPAVVIKKLIFAQSLGDYFLTYESQPLNAAPTPGPAVAKIPELRNSITAQVIYGVQYVYTYPNNPAGGGPSTNQYAYVTRKQALGSDQTQFDEQEVTPPFCAAHGPGIDSQPFGQGDIIYAVQMDTGVMSDPKDLVTSINGVPAAIGWMHFTTAKAWTSLNNQALF